MLEDAKDFPEWVRKIEDDIGQAMAFMFINFDESVRDSLVARSDLFQRFDMDKQRFFKWSIFKFNEDENWWMEESAVSRSSWIIQSFI